MLLAIAFALAASVGFGTGSVLIRVGTQHVSSPVATTLAVATGAVVSTTLALIFDFAELKHLPAIAFAWFFVLAVMGYPLGRLLNYTSISMIGAARTAPIDSLRPIFAMGLAIVFLGERPTLLITLGTPVIVLGLVFVIIGGTRESSRAAVTNRLGFLLSVAAAISFGGREVISRYVVSDIATPLLTSSFGFLMGATMLSLMSFPVLSRNIQQPSKRGLWFCVLAGASQSLANICVFYALSQAPVTVVSPIYSATPLIVLALSHFFLQRIEAVNWGLALGTLLSVGGVAMVIAGANSAGQL